MLSIAAKPLSQNASAKLDEYTTEILSSGDFPEQVSKAKSLWDAKTPANVFAELKSTLAGMCSGLSRCMYCEDSEADEIEHRRPKRLYPQQAFDWDNLLYACGVCNSPKSNQFAVLNPPFSVGYTEILAKRNAVPIPPSPGLDALIDPRKENPMDFLELDLEETFRFSPRIANKNSLHYWKAEYTIKLLKLNRETLWKARRCAFHAYRSGLLEYTTDQPAQRLPFQEFLRESYHRTVWEEMKRQHAKIKNLRDLFKQAPEVLAW